jgi:hypothetical protein
VTNREREKDYRNHKSDDYKNDLKSMETYRKIGSQIDGRRLQFFVLEHLRHVQFFLFCFFKRLFCNLNIRLTGKRIEKINDLANYKWCVLKECVTECDPSTPLIENRQI